MKDISVAFLHEMLENFSYTSCHDIIELYKLYTGVEVDSNTDLIQASNEFFDFLTNVKGYENSLKQASVSSAKSLLMLDINATVKPNYQSEFAQIAMEISPQTASATKILDVGPGEIPISSIAFTKSAGEVSAMDKNFYLATQCLRALNINGMEEYFTEETDISNYNYVVGKCPCSAIEPIVRVCAKQNKPYFIELCDCNLPYRPYLIKLDENGWQLSPWQTILPEIDPNIKFYDNYAFNLDVTPAQVKKAEEKHSIKKPISKPSISISTISASKKVSWTTDDEELTSSFWF